MKLKASLYFLLGLVSLPLYVVKASLRGSDNAPLTTTVEENQHHRHLATCGNGNRGDGVCSNGMCCSQYGWCGTSSAHCTSSTGGGTCGNGNRGNGVCANGMCCSQYGWCGTSSAHCTSSTGGGTCGNGNRGNGVCANGMCCSQYGWCGTSSAHCTSSGTGGSGGITASRKTITISDLQAGLNKYSSLQAESSLTATQAMVNRLNTATSKSGWTLYRQIAFMAHVIWESGGLRYTEELAAINSPYTTKGDYQTCDWNTNAQATNGQFFYGRGYLQLSWCANYLAYGRARMINNDPNYFYTNPNVVATTYAWDSAAWFFEVNVKDTTGKFGLTTKDINGSIECQSSNNNAGSAPSKRYQIFKALADTVGLTGYQEGGCYN